MTIDVATVVLGLDATARPAVQKAMAAFAETGDTKTKTGLARLLHDAVGVLRAHLAHATHAFAESTTPLPDDGARQRFVEATHRARSRFDVEIVRNADGTTTKKAPPPLATSDEPGVVLVTVVVARRSEITDVPSHPDRATLEVLLVELASTAPDGLVAMEVIWSPAAEADRVSPAALEARHPEIRRLA